MATKKQDVKLLDVQDEFYAVACGLKAFCHALGSVYADGLDEDVANGFSWLGQYVIDQVEDVRSKLQTLSEGQQELPALKKTIHLA